MKFGEDWTMYARVLRRSFAALQLGPYYLGTLGYLHNPGSLSNMSEMSHYGMHTSLQTSEALICLRQS